MPFVMRLLAPIMKPTIIDGDDLRRYVGLVTAVCICIALTLDIVSQLVFFTTWTTALRSWALTVIAAVVTAVPISLLVGRSQRELFHAKRRLEDISRTDVLTGLPNRRALMTAVDDGDVDLIVLVIADIDRFKAVNDTYGHRVGDIVLREVARIIDDEFRGLGMVGRLGGEEFAMLAPAASVDACLAALTRLQQRIASTPMIAGGASVVVTISAGAAIREPGEPFDHLYMEADEALYRAKAAGRNRIELSPRLRQTREGERDGRGRDAA